MTAGRAVVGALVVDGLGRVFVQRRSPDRRLFPGCWDVVGGRVEDGERPLAALRREIEEETGWRLRRVLGLLSVRDWEADGVTHTEHDYLVEVDGDLAAPRLEAGKHTRGAWLGPGDLGLLDVNLRLSGSPFVHDLVRAAHTWLGRHRTPGPAPR
ncbi:NUDIX hydrolase [Streptomyces sp. NPDC007088]|uniref:NUDIX hydrolase n=1 Tax=Streptomyces sp. NPDC007088 TaxID=3364773 RepID=UPI00367BC1F7